MKINPNDPAIPTMEHVYDNFGSSSIQTTPGMTIRAHFAGLAMQGLLANPDYMTTFQGDKYIREGQYIAHIATSTADALIAELNKEK